MENSVFPRIPMQVISTLLRLSPFFIAIGNKSGTFMKATQLRAVAHGRLPFVYRCNAMHRMPTRACGLNAKASGFGSICAEWNPLFNRLIQ